MKLDTIDNVGTNTVGCIIENILTVIRRRPQWVNWRYEERGQKKPTKVPYTPGTSQKASTTNLLTWRTFEEAVGALESGSYTGIGFVFCSADPFVGIDVDNCRNPETGEVDPQVLALIAKYEKSYTEVSASGTGIHLVTVGKIRGGTKKGDYEMYWTCIGSVDCLRLSTVRGKESIATNKPGLPTGVSPRSYPAG